MPKRVIKSAMAGLLTGAVHLDIMRDVEANHGRWWHLFHGFVNTAGIFIARLTH